MNATASTGIYGNTTLPTVPITVPEAAQLLGVTDKTVRRWIGEGRVHAWRRGPRKLYLDRTELEAMYAPVAPR